MNKITTQVNAFRRVDDRVHAVVLGRADKSLLGTEVALYYKKRLFAEGYLHNMEIRTLSEVALDDLVLLPKVFHSKEIFWSKLERAYGGGLPGEFEVTFLTLSDEPVQLTPKHRRVPTLPIRAKTYDELVSSAGSLKDFLG
jgi:hypothetical protein